MEAAAVGISDWADLAGEETRRIRLTGKMEPPIQAAVAAVVKIIIMVGMAVQAL